MSEHKILYRRSMSSAIHDDEIDLWRESYQENCDCARAIEKIITDNYDGRSFGDNLAAPIIQQYGFDRVNWVLANTLRENRHDGRFSQENVYWAMQFPVPKEDINRRFCVETHPGLTNLFLNEVRNAWKGLGLFDRSHCHSETEGELNYTGQMLVIRPNVLKDAYKTPEDQLFLAESGFGCSPNSRGRKVFGVFLKDGEKTHFYREDFLGILKDEYLPGWAAEKLAELRPSDETMTEDTPEGISMGGMS